MNQYGDLNSIKENAESIKGVVGENLRNALDDLDRNLELVSLKNDVEINQTFESLLVPNPNEEELNKIFAELEFKALDKNKEKEAPKKDSNYEIILDEKGLKNWIAKINKSKAFAIDTETDSVETVSQTL